MVQSFNIYAPSARQMASTCLSVPSFGQAVRKPSMQVVRVVSLPSSPPCMRSASQETPTNHRLHCRIRLRKAWSHRGHFAVVFPGAEKSFDFALRELGLRV